MATIICSRTATTSPFSVERLRESVLSACYSVRLTEGMAEDSAVHICQVIERWLEAKTEVTSADIRRKTAEVLGRLCPEAGYLYQHQHTIL